MTDNDPAWLDKEYNPLLVIDPKATFGAWAARSANAREKLPCHLDLAYGATPAEKLDIVTASAGDAPIIVFVHGGFWRDSDKAGTPLLPLRLRHPAPWW